MTMFRKLAALGSALLWSTSLAVAQTEPIRLGHFGSLTGNEATFGQMTDKGVRLAADEINAAGGLLGRQVEIITEDTRSRPGESATVVQKLISRDRVTALIGEVASGRSLEAAPIAQRFGVPMVSPSSTNPRVTDVGNFIFRVCFIDPFQGSVMATFARETLKLEKVAVLKDAGAAYSLGLAKYFNDRFAQLGGTVVLERNYQGGDRDFRPQLTAIQAAGVDGIFLPAYYTEAALVIRQAREIGLNIPIFGGDGWESPSLMEVGGEAVNGTYYSTHFHPDQDNPEAKRFVEAFRAKYGEAPDAMAALGYDSVMVIADAIRRADSADRRKIREALAATKDFAGATGRTTLNTQRNAEKAAVIIAVRNGGFVFEKVVQP